MTPEETGDSIRKLLEAQEAFSRKLQRSKERFDQLAEQSHTFIWEVDTQGIYTYVNHTVLVVLGYSPDEMVGRGFWEFNVGADREAIQKMASDIILKELPFKNFENRMLHKSGRDIWVQTNGLPLRNEEGQFIGYRGMDMEITERKRLEIELREATEKIRRAYQSKTEFLSNMSYEIRTPMTALIGYIHLLEGTSLTEEQRNYLSSASQSAHMLMTVLENILDFNQMETHSITMKTMDFSVRELLDSCLAPIAALACHKQLEVICTVDPTVPGLICGDPFRLRQIINNLLANAVKGSRNGEVMISCGVQTGPEGQNLLSIEITDCGSGGLRPDIQEMEMETGLVVGVSLSLRLVEWMGGSIGRVPQANGGTLCWFTIPFQVPHPAEDTATVYLPPNSESFKQLRVLIVEDHRGSREQLTKFCTGLGMEVFAVPTASAAIQVLENRHHDGQRFDVVFLDQDLPGIESKDLASSLRADDRFRDLHIVLMGSIGGKPSPEELRNHSLSHIYKPIRESELRHALDHFLKTNRSEGLVPRCRQKVL